MKKSTGLLFALCGTLLFVLLFITGRMLFIKLHTQSLEQIAGRSIQHELVLTENDTVLPTVTDENAVSSFIDLLAAYTYTEYPHFFKPDTEKLSANRLTVTFENGHSIGVDADGYVFVSGKLRDIEDSRGQELYHKLYLLFHPNAC